MTGGAIWVPRDLWDDSTFPPEKFSKREAWLWLLAEAAWKRRSRNIDGRTYELARGQLAGSVRYLAKAWGWPKTTAHRFLELLKKRDKIAMDAGTGVLIVTIRNYDVLQGQQGYGGTEGKDEPGQWRDTGGTNEKKGIRESDGGGGGAHAHAREAPPHQQDGGPTLRERILAAIPGVDPVSGITGPNGRMLGTQADMAAVKAWITDLGLDPDEVVGVVTEVMATKRDGPPRTLAYFRPQMQALAAAKAAPPIPIPQFAPLPEGPQFYPSHQHQETSRDRRIAAATERTRRIILAAARGTTSGGDRPEGFGDP